MSSKLILLAAGSQADMLLFERAAQAVGLANSLHPVSSGAEALRYLAGEDEYADRRRYPFPSVMFIGLRDADGFQLLAQVRTRFTREQLLVAVLSDSDDPTVVRRASLLRANAFFSKPPRPADLKNLADQFSSYFYSLCFFSLLLPSVGL